MGKGTLRQILLVTDGQSNSGEDPVAIAALAREKGIVVNVIGIVHESHGNNDGRKEIEDIALSGGGISEIVHTDRLTKTVQMVTRQAMTKTIHGVVNKELQHILGAKTNVLDLDPTTRGEVMEVVDELGETMDLHVAILIDTSASMQSKLQAVQEAMIDLSLSLSARTGENKFSLYTFPSKRKDVEKKLDWSPSLQSLPEIIQKVSTGGITPTGPALRYIVATFNEREGVIDEEGDFFQRFSM